MRIISVNLNGIRSAANKGFFQWLQTSQADVVCMQEIKAQATDLSPEMLAPAGYYGFFHYAKKKGYSGVGIYCKIKPNAVIEGLGHPEIDSEGRYLELQFDDFSVVSLYLPSGSSGAERQAFKFEVMKRILPHFEAMITCGREIVICGDWNIAHQEIDLKNFKGNKKNSGFLPEERAWLTDVFNRIGWVDVYRKLNPSTTDESYTWWSNRGEAYKKNIGWRIDYQVATSKIAEKAQNTSVYKTIRFSDHAPLIVDYQ